MWWTLMALCGVGYIVARAVGESRSEWWVLAAAAFLFMVLAINAEIDDREHPPPLR
jgi:hypothetical protein